MYKKYFLDFCLILFSNYGFSANNGKITYMNFAGENSPSHPDVVQIQIEGGFSLGACNTTFAAIRKTDTHLISMALAAYTTGKTVKVSLNSNDIYFSSQNRCAIYMISF